MKRTRWMLFYTFLFCICIHPTKAQEQTTTSIEVCVQRAVSRWSSDLSLTQNQKTALLVLTKRFIIVRDSINELDSISFEVRQSIKKEALENHQIEIEALLSLEQKQQLAIKRSERKNIAEMKQASKKKN